MPNGRSEVHYAATMGGFGQFGRTPGDLVRLHRLLPAPRAVAARLLGIERSNNVEYVLAVLFRAASCALLGGSATEVVEVRADDREEVLPLLAGGVMNFPFKELPIDPEVRVKDEAVSLHLVPYTGRLSTLLLVLAPRRLLRGALQIRIEGQDRVEIRLLDRNTAEFFLDEDPMTFHSRLTLQVAGSLASTYRPRSPSRASLREERRSTAMRIWRISPRREMYLKSLEAFGRYRSFEATYRIPLDDLSPGDTIGALVETLRLTS